MGQRGQGRSQRSRGKMLNRHQFGVEGTVGLRTGRRQKAEGRSQKAEVRRGRRRQVKRQESEAKRQSLSRTRSDVRS